MKRILPVLVLATLHCAAVRPFFSQSIIEEKAEEIREKGACWGTGYVGKELREKHPNVAAAQAKAAAKGHYLRKCTINPEIAGYPISTLYDSDNGYAISYSSYYENN